MKREIRIPKLGMSTVDVDIVEWLVAPGDTVSQGTPLLIVETEKVDTEIASEVDGRVVELLVDEGTTVEVGTIICLIEES